MDSARLVERIWWGDQVADQLARMALAPFGAAYGAVMAGRNALYDVEALRSVEPAIPAISVGNLTVGGTGKTPIASWLASELAARGARPAIVLRGYGGDEPLVHETLHPGMTVVADSDRVTAIASAAARGADIAVLDDAFQHRRVRRVADIVLVSADRWTRHRWLLPAGPWREGLRGLRRATFALVVRKAASRGDGERVMHAVSSAAPDVPRASMLLAMQDARRVDGQAITTVRELVAGRPVVAISAIGDPRSFDRQLEALGARVEARHFPDHHRFTRDDVAGLAALIGERIAVCTLKDAVKLGSMWPPAPVLWYVTQSVIVESGGDAISSALETALRARHAHPHSAATALGASPSP